jgi:hypothetical protein
MTRRAALNLAWSSSGVVLRRLRSKWNHTYDDLDTIRAYIFPLIGWEKSAIVPHGGQPRMAANQSATVATMSWSLTGSRTERL